MTIGGRPVPTWAPSSAPTTKGGNIAILFAMKAFAGVGRGDRGEVTAPAKPAA